jgi:hypothetical protein
MPAWIPERAFAIRTRIDVFVPRNPCGDSELGAKAGEQAGNQPHYLEKNRATELRDQGWGQIRIPESRASVWSREHVASRGAPAAEPAK